MKLFKLSLTVLLPLFLASTGCMQDANKPDNNITRQDVIIAGLIENAMSQQREIQERFDAQDKSKPTTKLHIAAELGFFDFILVWLTKNYKNSDFISNINAKNHAFLTPKQVARYSMHNEIVQLIEKYEA